jgi:hypothetical protein
MRSRGFPLPVIAVCLAAVNLWTRQVPAGSAVAQYLSSRSLDEMKGDLSGVACDVSGHCQIVGAFAVPNPKHSLMAVLSTSNGGASWKRGASSAFGELNGVTCVSSSSCWSVGSTGGFTIPRLLRTTDGGAEWSLQSVALHGEPLAISCGATSTCVVGGVLSEPNATRTSAPLVTHDGGDVWTASHPASWMAGATVSRVPPRRSVRSSAHGTRACFPRRPSDAPPTEGGRGSNNGPTCVRSTQACRQSAVRRHPSAKRLAASQDAQPS